MWRVWQPLQVRPPMVEHNLNLALSLKAIFNKMLPLRVDLCHLFDYFTTIKNNFLMVLLLASLFFVDFWQRELKLGPDNSMQLIATIRQSLRDRFLRTRASGIQTFGFSNLKSPLSHCTKLRRSNRLNFLIKNICNQIIF